MSAKDPSFWMLMMGALRENGVSVALAFVLGYIRILYDRSEPDPVRQLLEASLGALLVLLVGLGTKQFGINGGWSYAVAGFVGVLGVNQVRVLAQKWANKRMGE